MEIFNEIGGNFWLSSEQLVQQVKTDPCNINILQDNEHKMFTSSGRGAIKLLLGNLIQNIRTALLPAYTCDSVLKPFRENKFDLNFYGINKDLSVNLVDLLDKIKMYKPGVIFLQSYFGFDTLKTLRPYYNELQSQGIVIIEDLTHSWLSNFDKSGADYYITSLRKWLEIPDGGALLSIKNELNGLSLNLTEHQEVLGLFREASRLKNKYIQTMKPETKERFRPLFYRIESILDFDTHIYSISKLTTNLLNGADFEKIKQKRQSNFSILLQGIFNCKNVIPVFNALPDGVTPLYFPVFVLGNREDLQKQLAQKGIYCPVIWPIPQEIEEMSEINNLYFQTDILSIPCDQRYTSMDMVRIIVNISQNKFIRRQLL